MREFSYLFFCSLLILCTSSISLADPEDYYKTLQIERTASDSEIKQAYNKLTKIYHPDNPNSPDPTGKVVKDLIDAYNVLKDPKKRENYDRFGHTKPEQKQTNTTTSAEFEQRASYDPFKKSVDPDRLAENYYFYSFLKYDSNKKAFYDTRTNTWARFNPHRGESFYTDEGFELQLNEKASYYDHKSDSFRYPVDPTLSTLSDWTRYREGTKVDIKTGLNLDYKYAPLTHSSHSELFDQILFPQNLESRAKLVAQAQALEWTEVQKIDFLTRAKLLLGALHVGLEGNNVLNGRTDARILEAVYGLPFALDFPELYDKLETLPEIYKHVLAGNILSQSDMITQPRVQKLMRSFLKSEEFGKWLWYGIKKRYEKDLNFPFETVKTILSLTDRQLTETEVSHLVEILNSSTDAEKEALKKPLLEMTVNGNFMEYLTGNKGNNDYIQQMRFLKWIKKFKLKSTELLEQSLKHEPVNYIRDYSIHSEITKKYPRKEFLDSVDYEEARDKDSEKLRKMDAQEQKKNALASAKKPKKCLVLDKVK